MRTPTLRVEGHLVLGVSLTFLGRLRSGMENLERHRHLDREHHA